ncbi:PaaX family transcriptional regulator C-terminal domain-containing protein [Geodermatophilus chilensis]|uniref:PaaX family transcriptional regulator C-terminal domain-containing protein n=1 Tax=Geodermatophilus chilensis TaxID=2035835 RepID=UPI000C262801|nr:PaaX family transcriptional regulator C-terminal domain-containing protein [Geodermatophilus chilensis]
MTVRDLFAEHLDAVTDRPVRLRSLVALLQAFDVAEPTARTTTAALRRSGWLAATRHGRETLYTPTEALRGTVRRRWARIDERLGPWDGHWRVVIYTVPETDRAARERVRRTLARQGFGPLAPATWVSPHRAALDEVRTELADEPLGRLDLLTARVAAETGDSDRELAACCWDLLGLAAAYRREIDRLRRVLAGPVPHGATALVTHLRGLAAVRRIGSGDPLLPTGLRPAGWPGPEMRDTWAEFSDRLRAPAPASTSPPSSTGRARGPLPPAASLRAAGGRGSSSEA